MDFARWALHRREATPRGARHNRNRLQANIVSAAGGKTAPYHGARRALKFAKTGDTRINAVKCLKSMLQADFSIHDNAVLG